MYSKNRGDMYEHKDVGYSGLHTEQIQFAR